MMMMTFDDDDDSLDRQRLVNVFQGNCGTLDQFQPVTQQTSINPTTGTCGKHIGDKDDSEFLRNNGILFLIVYNQQTNRMAIRIY